MVRSGIPTLASATCSVAVGTALWGLRAAVVVCLIVVVHEFGHYAVARLGRLTICAPIVALPLGGLVLFDPSRSPRPQRAGAAVIVAGPLCGALGAVIAAAGWGLTHNWWVLAFAQASVWFNLINLFPTGILDGHTARGPRSRHRRRTQGCPAHCGGRRSNDRNPPVPAARGPPAYADVAANCAPPSPTCLLRVTANHFLDSPIPVP